MCKIIPFDFLDLLLSTGNNFTKVEPGHKAQNRIIYFRRFSRVLYTSGTIHWRLCPSLLRRERRRG